MGAFNGIGDLGIVVGGDLGPLKQALDQIPALAKQAGEAAAQALSAAASGGAGADQAFAGAASAAKALSDAMQGTVAAAVDLDKELQSKQVDSQNAADAFRELGSQLRDAGAAMVLVGGALSTISAGLIEVGAHALESAGQIEQAQVAMTVLSGSAERSSTLIKGLIDFAAVTPFQIPGVVEMGQKLVGFGIETEKVIPMLRTLGDVASGSGRGFAGLTALVNDFGRMINQQTVHLRDINTLAYQGVPAIQALADAYQVSTNRMRQMIQQNLIKTADALPVLMDAMDSKFAGSMEKQSQTLLGLFSNFKDNVIKTLIAIGDALIPVAKSIMSAIMPILESIQALAEWFGKLPAPIQNVALAFTGMAVAIGPLVLALGGFVFVAGQIITTAPALLTFLGVELPAAATAAAAATETAATATTALSATFATALAAAGPWILLLAGAATGAAIGWAEGMGKIDALQAEFVKNTQGMAAEAAAMGKGMDDVAARIKLLVGAIEKYNETAKEKIELPTFDPKAADGIERYVASLDKLVNKIPGYKSTLKDLSGVISGVADDFSKLPKALGEFTAGGNSLDAVRIKTDALKEAQRDANNVLDLAQAAYDRLFKELGAGAPEVARAWNELQKALDAAHPAIRSVGAALKDTSNNFNEASKVIDDYSNIIQKFPGYVTNSMDKFRRALIDGFNPEAAIKSIDSLIAKMDALAASGDENAKGISEFFQKGRQDIINMLLALDPTKMQQFNINGVQVLKGGIEGLGASASEMAAKLAKALNIPEEAAAKLVNAWKVGMRDAQQATDGFTTTMVNGIAVITPYTDALKKATDGAHNFAGAQRSAGEAMVFTSGEWIKASELATRVSHAVNNAKAVAGDLGKVAQGGAMEIAQALAVDKKNLDALTMSASEFQRNYGGSMESARAATSAADKAFRDFGNTIDIFGKQFNKMEGSFMDGMNGMTVSGEQFIAMLSQMGALTSDLEHAAAAMGFLPQGQKSFINEAGAKAQGLLSDEAIQMMFHPMEWAKEKFAEFQQRLAEGAAALAANTKGVQDATKAQADAITVYVNGVKTTFASLDEWAKATGVKLTPVYQALSDTATAASGSIGSLGDAAQSTADVVDTSSTGLRSLSAGVNLAGQSVDSLLQSLTDLNNAGQATAASMQSAANIMDELYRRNYWRGGPIDALTVAMDNAKKATVDFSQSIDVTSSTTDQLIKVLTDVNAAVGGFANSTLAAKTILDELAKRNYWAGGMSTGDTPATRGKLNIPSDATNVVISPDGLHATWSSASDAARALAAAVNQAPTWSGPVMNPNAPGRTDAGSGLGLGVTNGWVPSSPGGVVVNVTGNYVLDQGTLNSLTTKIATQMTNTLRMNAGLKV